MDNPAECRVCFTIFTTQQRPRTFPCGHTFCSPCITNLLHQGTGHLTCPTCRVHHPAPDATHFPVNYGMEALIQQMQCLVHQRGVPAGVEVKGGEEVKDGVNAEVEELKARVINLILDCSTVKTQIQQNQEKLLKPQAHHTSLLTRLCNLVSENKGAMTRLMEAEEEYSSLISEGEDIMGRLQASVDQLETVTLMQQRRSAIYLTNNRVKEMEKWRKKFEEMKVGDEALDVSIKVLTATQEAVNTLARDGVDSEEAGTSADTTTTTQVSAVMDRAHHSMQQLPQSPTTLTTKDLLTLGTDMRRLLEARLVYGLHQETTDTLCSARLTLENGQFHLYHLAQRTPPHRAHTIQVTGYLSAPHPSLLVFLDLAWGGQVKGRVYIRLHLDTPLAKQFLLLCCGRHGHTYAGSPLLKVCGLRNQGEFIMGGDYDGSGGAPLVCDPYGTYRKTGCAGSVWGRFEVGDHRAAQFAITTRDCQGSIPRVFGCVEDGLGVVRAAVLALQVERVCVEECGVVLNL